MDSKCGWCGKKMKENYSGRGIMSALTSGRSDYCSQKCYRAACKDDPGLVKRKKRKGCIYLLIIIIFIIIGVITNKSEKSESRSDVETQHMVEKEYEERQAKETQRREEERQAKEAQRLEEERQAKEARKLEADRIVAEAQKEYEETLRKNAQAAGTSTDFDSEPTAASSGKPTKDEKRQMKQERKETKKAEKEARK